MQSNKEALLAIYRGEMPKFIPSIQKSTAGVVFPGDRYFGPEKTGRDAWGVNWTVLGPDPGLDGTMVTPGDQILDDISEWKEQVQFPNLEEIHAKEIMQGMMKATPNRDDYVIHVLFLSGPWERINQMMGMEDALCAFYEDPEALHELLEAICDYKIKCIDCAVEAVHPDVIHMQDDWGSANNMLFSPELWREFIKPIEKRLCDYIHEKGMIYEHHSCGYIQTIVPDLVEIGVDALNPLNVCNDVAWIKKNYGDKITIKGGADNQKIDRDGVSEEEIRQEVRRIMDAYAPGGRYMPEFTFTNAQRRAIFLDEVEKYGKDIYKGGR